MQQAKSGRCRFRFQIFLGRTTWSGRKVHTLVEVEHVGTPHEERKKDMSHFEKFITEGNEKADELAKRRGIAGQRVHEGSKSGNFAPGKRGGVRSHAVCGQLPLLSRTMEGL